MLRILKSNLIMRGLQIVKNFPQKQHTLPAHVLLNASEDLFKKGTLIRKRLPPNQFTMERVWY